MAKTLADMAAEERAECVGMWCECTTGHSKHMAVLLNDSGLIIFPHLLKSGTLEIGLITPRFDLPRAWTPDGEPDFAQALAEETWEYGVEYKYLTNRGAEWELDPSAGWHKTYRAAERAANMSVRFRIVRRRVSAPEVINE